MAEPRAQEQAATLAQWPGYGPRKTPPAAVTHPGERKLPMANNPIHDTPGRESRIRARAYRLWEADGRPEGRSGEYWEHVRELVAIEAHEAAAQLLTPMTQNEELPGVTVEEASVAANLGEFPDRFTDQGERRQVPMPNRSRRETKSETSATRRKKRS
jgi:Protein of unknown function (DUF2934)